MTTERRDILAQVAVWYYEDRLDQAEIARRIGKSRSMISRMLNEVRDLGMVEFRVKYPLRRNSRLEAELTERFGLKAAWVINRPDMWNDDMKDRMLGRAAASCFQRYIGDGVRVGLAWSRTLRHVVVEVSDQPIRDAVVVQLSGSISSENPEFDGPELVRELAHRLNAEYRYFPAPLVVREPGVKESLLAEASIAETLEAAANSDVAIVGVGNITTAGSSLRASGMLDQQTFDELVSRHVAGDIIARQFDEDGRLLPADFNDRVVGIAPEALRRIPTVIAVSGGSEKAPSIRAAMRGGWFNVLVSDEATVREVLEGAGDDIPVMSRQEAG